MTEIPVDVLNSYEYKKIMDYSAEYDVLKIGAILFVGWRIHTGDNGQLHEGCTVYKRVEKYDPLSYKTIEVRMADIYIHPFYKDNHTFRDCVLWHEFCHGWNFVIDNKKGHGWSFIKKLMKKPRLALLHFVMAFVVPFQRFKGFR